jgi:5-deoxy-D-glucuronate isomerase
LSELFGFAFLKTKLKKRMRKGKTKEVTAHQSNLKRVGWKVGYVRQNQGSIAQVYNVCSRERLVLWEGAAREWEEARGLRMHKQKKAFERKEPL